ncbi:MAG: cytochrome b/b6 domain-containing protein, partial [Haliea sp.]
MVMLLLISLLGTVGSGLMLYALEENAGPLAGLVETQPEGESGRQERRARQHGEEHEDDDAEERWEEIHELFVNLTLVLVALHLLGVLVSSLAERQNLVRSMVTGWKRTGPSSG